MLNTDDKLKKKDLYSLAIILFVAIFALRVIPHAPNFVPIFALICMFSGRIIPTKITIITTVIALVCSDLILSVMFDYPMFGSWSLFSYSGFLAVILFSSKFSLKNSRVFLFFTMLASVVGYWVWTNFGVWLFGDMYQYSLTGITACYIAAIPFLTQQLLSNVLGSFVLFVLFPQLKGNIRRSKLSFKIK